VSLGVEKVSELDSGFGVLKARKKVLLRLHTGGQLSGDSEGGRNEL
jgi:hypothetical protein